MRWYTQSVSTRPQSQSDSEQTSGGECVLYIDPTLAESDRAANHAIDALASRGIRTHTVADPRLAMAELLILDRNAPSEPPAGALLFIACTGEPGALEPLVRAISAYCPRVVSRSLDPSGPLRFTPFAFAPKPAPERNGTHPSGRKPELRLAGSSNGRPAPEPSPEEPTDTHTLSDDELNMLLSDEWDHRADGTSP